MEYLTLKIFIHLIEKYHRNLLLSNEDQITLSVKKVRLLKFF